MKIVSIVGSLRQDSWNHRLARLAARVLETRGVEVEEGNLAGLTLFNGDLDDGTFPEPVAALRDTMRAADGLLIACPEYNHSIPAVMKNAIEWTCRPPNCWTNKVVFGMGATPGRSGGIRMHLHLSDCLQCEGAWLIPRPMILVPNAASVFGPDGELLESSVGEQLEEAMTVLVETINTMTGARA
jgi:chromate reductase